MLQSGTGTNLIFAEQLDKLYGQEFTFFEWTSFVGPFSFAFLLIQYILIYFVYYAVRFVSLS